MDDLISRQAVLDLAKDLKFDNVEGLKYYRHRCIDPDDVRELPAAKIEYDVRFADEDHVWIDGERQYISLRRFQEAVASAKTDQKEGKWKRVDNYEQEVPIWKKIKMCSECGGLALLETNYCPNCGVKMKGEATT